MNGWGKTAKKKKEGRGRTEERRNGKIVIFILNNLKIISVKQRQNWKKKYKQNLQRQQLESRKQTNREEEAKITSQNNKDREKEWKLATQGEQIFKEKKQHQNR